MRGKQSKKRTIKPDPQYNSVMVTKFINYSMKDGKKSIARHMVYGAIEQAAKTLNKKPLEALETALGNIKPKLEVRSRRVGGANYQVPVPVPEGRQLALATRWLLTATKASRKKESFEQALSKEIIAACKKEGVAYKKKEDVEKMAEANRAFAHFQW
jgi:small subunit ribosomal protein S7